MLFPEPFGPMMACTSPALHVEVEAAKDLSSIDRCAAGFEFAASSQHSLRADAQQLSRFNGKFHRQFLQHLFAEAIDDC